MNIIKIDLEKTLKMYIQNEDFRQNNLGGDQGRIIINSLNQVSYHYPSNGTYYPHCYVVDPEKFFDIDSIDNEYGTLDLIGYRNDAKEIVSKEEHKDIEDFTNDDWDKVSGYQNEWVNEWVKVAMANKKESIFLGNKEYTVEWV